MKKILFIHPNLNPLNQGGAFTRLQLFMSSLHELNFNVSVMVFVPALKWPYVFYNRNKLDKNYNWILYPSFSFYTNNILGFLNRIYCSIIVSIIVRLKKIKLIQCELSSTLVLTKFCPENIKLISDFHADLFPELEFYNQSNWKIKLAKKETKYSLKNSDYIITVSSNLHTHLETFYNIPFKNVFQPCLPKLDLFDNNFKDRILKRKELSIHNKLVFGYLGGLQEYQCIDKSIELVEFLKKSKLNIFLCIFTNDNTDSLINKINSSSLDKSDYLIKNLKKEDVPIYTSIIDFGLLLRDNKTINLVSSPTKGLEYLASGTAVITTKHAGNIPDILNKSSSGFVFDNLKFKKKDIDNFILFINEFNKNRIQNFNLSKNLVKDKFNWKVFFDKIKHIYD